MEMYGRKVITDFRIYRNVREKKFMPDFRIYRNVWKKNHA